MMKPALVAASVMWAVVVLGGPDHLRQGYGGPPKLYAEAEGPPLRALAVGIMALQAQQTQQPQQQDEFVPIDQLPPQDQLPAAPLLVTAYAFAVLVLFAYLVSVARRLGAVQRDLERFQSDLKRSGRT